MYWAHICCPDLNDGGRSDPPIAQVRKSDPEIDSDFYGDLESELAREREKKPPPRKKKKSNVSFPVATYPPLVEGKHPFREPPLFVLQPRELLRHQFFTDIVASHTAPGQ